MADTGFIIFSGDFNVYPPEGGLRTCGVIYRVDVATGTQQQLTADYYDFGATLSPDGRQIAVTRSGCTKEQNAAEFTSDCSSIEAAFEIYVMNSDGIDLHAVTDLDATSTDPVWSPDGKRIAFNSTECSGHTEPQMHVVDANGQNYRLLTHETGIFILPPAWIAATGEVAYLRAEKQDGGMYAVDVESRNVRRVNDLQLWWSDTGRPFSFSPDGRRVAYKLDKGLYVADTNGENPVLLSDANLFNSNPIWSPDGKQIAFQSWFERQGLGFCCYTRIFRINADGTDMQQLTDNQDTDLGSFTWSPDGKQIAYTTGKDIIIMDADGSNQRLLLTTDVNVNRLHWLGG